MLNVLNNVHQGDKIVMKIARVVVCIIFGFAHAQPHRFSFGRIQKTLTLNAESNILSLRAFRDMFCFGHIQHHFLALDVFNTI